MSTDNGAPFSTSQSDNSVGNQENSSNENKYISVRESKAVPESDGIPTSKRNPTRDKTHWELASESLEKIKEEEMAISYV